MARRTKILILVVLVGIITAVLSLAKQEPVSFQTLLQAGVITAILDGMALIFTHYGWRFPLFHHITTSPDLRGTWRFEDSTVFVVRQKSAFVLEKLTSGFVVISQTNSEIRVTIYWDNDKPSEVDHPAPYKVHEGKLAYTGTFTEVTGEDRTQHAYGAFIAFGTKDSVELSLKYRTDHGVTGSLLAKNRQCWHATSNDDGKKRAQSGLSLWQRIKFALHLR